MAISYHIQPSLFDSDDTPHKKCSKCKQMKPLTEFHKDRTQPDKHRVVCKECRRVPPKPIDMLHSGEKRCASCKQWLPATLEYFFRDKKRPDKLYPYCKSCDSAKRKVQHPKQIKVSDVPEGMKRCTKCQEILPVEAFSTLQRGTDRRNSICKGCVNKRNRERTKDIPHVINPQAPTKVCSECGDELASTLENFGFCRRSKDRLRSCCKKCDNKRSKAWNQSPQGQEMTRAYTQEHKEELNEYRREYRKTHRDEELAYKRQYHEEHKEEEKAYTKEVRSTPEGKLKRRIEAHNRRANKKAVPGEHSLEEILEQLKRQKYRCYYAACGHSKFPRVKENGEWKYEYHVDHTYPISRIAGTDIPGNDMGYLVLTCKSCNVHKWSKFPWEWPEGGRLL